MTLVKKKVWFQCASSMVQFDRKRKLYENGKYLQALNEKSKIYCERL